MILQQRYLARFVGPKNGVPVYALGCPGSGSGPAAFQDNVPRVLARFLGLKGSVPLYGYSTCEFPRIGRYLMRFIGMAADGAPVYAVGCCPEGSSGSSGASGLSGESGSSGLSGLSGESGLSGLSGSLGESGLSGSSGSSGCSCPEYPWQTEAFDGATWTGADWSLRITFEDSANCGGLNTNTQFGTASRRVCLCVPMRLTIHMVGVIEQQDTGYEYAEVRVNGDLIAFGGSVGEGLGCAMATATVDGDIDLPPGEHVIELFSSTIDQYYHVGAYWEFHFTWEPL